MMKLCNQLRRGMPTLHREVQIFLLLLLSILFCTSNINAASDPSFKLTFNFKDQPMAAIMNAVEKETGYTFFYDNSKIITTKKATVICSNSSLNDVLTRLFAGTAIKHHIVDKNIVLSLSDKNNQADLTDAVSAQKVKISGTVVDKDGEPIIGATIRDAKNKQVGTITDLDGNFELSVPENTSIEIHSIMFETKLIAVKGKSTIKVTLNQEEKLLEELVVVGYDTQRRANLTGAVGTVNVNKQMGGRPITDAGRALQGATPGLTVSTSSGQIGGDPAFKIRGAIGSINGSSKPLILLDNVEVSNLSVINPDDIESVSVLKDAASASIYGTRAAFGVILITSKTAKKGDRTTINYSTNLSWNRPTTTPEIVKSYEGAQMALDAGRRVNPNLTQVINTINSVWNEETIDRMKEWERVYGGYNLGDEMVLGRDFDIKDGHMYFYRSFDAPDKFIKKNTFNQQHNLSINGSSSNTLYNLSLGYLGQSGVMKVNPDEFKRYNVSFNTTTEIKKWLSVRSKLLYSKSDFDTPYSFTPEKYSPWYYLYRWPRTIPYGTYDGIPFRNAASETAQANTNTRTNNYTRINLGATLKIMEGLTLDADYTFIHTDRLLTTRGGEARGWDFWTLGGGMIDRVWTASNMNQFAKSTDLSDWHTANVVARWEKRLKEEHKINVLAGTNLESYSSTGHNGSQTNLIDITMPEFNLANGIQGVGGYSSQWATAGFFARVNYSYKDRYLLELNGRYDGSSRFPMDKLWGFFPSASAGYILSEEDFMKPLQPWLSFTKLRVSWGSVGNQDVGTHRFLPIMSSIQSQWIIGNTIEKSYSLPRAISDGFSWEKVTTTNIGFDTRFFNDKLGVSLDLYKRVTSDMIMASEKLPASMGITPPEINVGELTTKGFELAVDFRHKFSNGLHLTATATLSDQKIKYSKLATSNRIISGLYEGKTHGEIWGFETDRYFTKDDFDVDPHGKLILKPDIADQKYYETNGWFYYGPGDIKYKDLDGSGSIDIGKNTVEDPGDQKVIGNSTPRYEFGFRLGGEWKGFDLDIFLQGVGKRDLWASGSVIIPGFNYTEAWYTHQLDYWTPENTNAFYPRISNLGQTNTQNFLPQTKYLLDMSYCRVKNITLGYALPKSLLQRANLSKLRVYVSFENLFEFDNLGEIPIDPETGLTTGDGDYIGRSYPYTRAASVGLQLTF